MALADFNMITDRTQMDVDRWKELKAKGWDGMTAEEQAEWSTSLRGCYNYTDMNRVESAVEYVANRLIEVGYPVYPVVKKNWQLSDKPTRADFARYMQNIADIRGAMATYPTTPAAPTTNQQLTYQLANDLEKILVDIDELVTLLVNAYFYCGEIYAGES